MVTIRGGTLYSASNTFQVGSKQKAALNIKLNCITSFKNKVWLNNNGNNSLLQLM